MFFKFLAKASYVLAITDIRWDFISVFISCV